MISTTRRTQFCRSLRRRNIRHTVTVNECNIAPNFHPINLSSRGLTQAENNILSTGPLFYPTPTEINWLEIQHDLDRHHTAIEIEIKIQLCK